jgi:mono/diheme cytochrome c family protein
MTRRFYQPVKFVGSIVIVIAAILAAPSGAQETAAPSASSPSGWQLPADAAATKNPLTVDETVLASGKALFKDKCERCHGPAGLGDGEDADPDAQEDMDLTTPKRAARNPDGVVYYKVLNGRRRPKMPAFKEELTPEQIWTVVAYTQSLRRK